jgi:hypothetical protein
MARIGGRGGPGSGGDRILTIVSVAYPLAPVSLDVAGGSEQILAQLDRGLVDAGHSSVIIAAEGSQVRGELTWTHWIPGERYRRDGRGNWEDRPLKPCGLPAGGAYAFLWSTHGGAVHASVSATSRVRSSTSPCHRVMATGRPAVIDINFAWGAPSG